LYQPQQRRKSARGSNAFYLKSFKRIDFVGQLKEKEKNLNLFLRYLCVCVCVLGNKRSDQRLSRFLSFLVFRDLVASFTCSSVCSTRAIGFVNKIIFFSRDDGARVKRCVTVQSRRAKDFLKREKAEKKIDLSTQRPKAAKAAR